MELFSAFRGKRLNTKWQFCANGQIWRILISDDGLIVGEDREIDKKQVSFFCLNADNGLALWRDKTLQTPWWIELSMIHRNVVFFHEFESADLPEHKRIIALDLHTGDLLWENPEFRLLFASDESVYVQKNTFENLLYFELEYESGNVLREVNQSHINALRGDILSKKKFAFHTPQVLHLQNTSKNAIITILENRKSKNNLLEYAEYWSNDSIVVTCYYENIGSTLEQKRMRQLIEVFDIQRSKSIFVDEILASAVSIVPNGFFYMDGSIFYVQERNNLKAVQLLSKK